MKEHTWTLTVWGTRGSVPVAASDVMEYGGNTSCVSVDTGDELVVFDAGSGLIRLGSQLERPRRVHILLSHLHMDHLIGLFSFRPLHNPGMEIHLYGEAGVGAQLERLIGPPFWPLGLNDFQARITIHETGPGVRFLLAGANGLFVDTLRGSHPNQSLLYRLKRGEKCVVYALDCELSGGIFEPLASFARNCGILVWDATFAPSDLRPGWGHSTWEQGITLGKAAGAGMVLMTHYNWSYTDRFLQEQERLAAAAHSAARFAKERMEIQL